ncbi:MAG: hypothetical protein JXB32_23730 [Deltaproteobacteria bacterium]|nr:hypothetical protein [Deltaproteobacteria bacterium]
MKVHGWGVVLAACAAAASPAGGCGKKEPVATGDAGGAAEPVATGDAGGAAEPVATGEASTWRVASVVATEVPEYGESVNPLQEFRLVPEAGERLVRVEFELEAGSADPGAVEALAQARSRIDASVPEDSQLRGLFRFTLPDDARATLGGTYRLFDTAQFVLVDGGGGRHVAEWCVRPERGDLSLYWKGGTLDTCVDADDPEGWHGFVRSAKTTVGLLETGRKEAVSLLYRLPAGVPVDSLRLDVGSVGPVPVRWAGP